MMFLVRHGQFENTLVNEQDGDEVSRRKIISDPLPVYTSTSTLGCSEIYGERTPGHRFKILRSSRPKTS